MTARLVWTGILLFVTSVSNVAAFEQIVLTDQWIYVDVWWDNTTSGGTVYASAESPFDIVDGLDALGFGVKGTRDAILVISNIKVKKGYVTAHDSSPADQAAGVPAGPVTLTWAIGGWTKCLRKAASSPPWKVRSGRSGRSNRLPSRSESPMT